MDKIYDHKKYEAQIYKLWEQGGAFMPKDEPEGKPFTIIMPPPNANGDLHLGHVTFVAVSDVLIRYHRMRGDSTLWLPGIDHAGIATQASFEKILLKLENKTRHDLGRDEFYKRCYQFCLDCKSKIEGQFRALGASCDWSREKFTLDPEISKLVFETFVKMYKDGLVYRGYRVVNWCPRCRSTLSELELEWTERIDSLYFVRYRKASGDGYVTVATTRPEPIWADTHLAVNPSDKKNSKLIGEKLLNPLTGEPMEVIGDDMVDPKFGTGIVKLTPAHDSIDYEVAQRHNLPITQAIDFDGRMLPGAGKYAGLKTKAARQAVVADLSQMDLIEKIDEKYSHAIASCERCGTVIEPLVSRQWFIKIKSLAEPAIKAVEEDRVKITPIKYQKMYFNWMKNIKDWPISRQLWWGHQLPVWYCEGCQKTKNQKSEFDLLRNGDTRARTDALEDPTVSLERPEKCLKCSGTNFVQDPDTFDTWFSSGQWPVNTLKTAEKSDFGRFYPTSVMNTAYEILFLWVARMIMFGLYLTGEVPFKTALINGVLRDEKGIKMSKSLGNGVNPDEAIDKFGADAVRMSLNTGRDTGNDLLIPKQKMEEQIRGQRNFANKIWNMGRYLEMSFEGVDPKIIPFVKPEKLNKVDEQILADLELTIKKLTDLFEKFKVGPAASEIYEFAWHRFADQYIEESKDKARSKDPTTLYTLRYVYLTVLKLLHPFMPFVTEAVWSELKDLRPKPDGMLIVSKWPE